MAGEEARRQLHKNVASNIDQNPGGNIPPGTNYTATCLPSWKLSKLDEPDMQDTAGEAGTSSYVMYSYGPPHMAEQKQDDQLEHTYSSYVRIWDVALKTCQRWWTIGRSGVRGSGISVLAARHDDEDDDDYIYIYIYICVCVCVCVFELIWLNLICCIFFIFLINNFCLFIVASCLFLNSNDIIVGCLIAIFEWFWFKNSCN